MVSFVLNGQGDTMQHYLHADLMIYKESEAVEGEMKGVGKERSQNPSLDAPLTLRTISMKWTILWPVTSGLDKFGNQWG